MKIGVSVVLIGVLAAGAASAQSGDAPVPGTALTPDILGPQPFEETPLLRAPADPSGDLMRAPGDPTPSAPPVPAPLVEMPGDADARPEADDRAETVPLPEARPALPRRAIMVPRRDSVPVRRGPDRRAGRPLVILPMVAEVSVGASSPVRAFAPQPRAGIAWPFPFGTAASRFNVPAGLW